MADNYVCSPGSGGDTFAADDVGGIKTPRVKLQWGPDGTVNDADIATGKPIPVQLRGSDGTDRSNALPVSGTVGISGTVAITANSSVNMAQINGATVASGNGTATGAQRVVIASDNTAHAINMSQINGSAVATGNGTAATAQRVVIASDNSTQSINIGQISGTGAAINNGTANAGTQRVVIASDNTAFTVNAAQSGAWSLAANQSVNNAQIGGVAVATGNGNVSTGVQRVAIAADNTAFNVNAAAKVGTSGGATPYKYFAAASANQDSQSVKGSAGQLYGYDLFNANAALRYVKIYDKATAPTSADTPKLVIMVPGNTAGAGAVKDFANGVVFASGIGMRITTGQADGDTTAATAADVVVNLQYS